MRCLLTGAKGFVGSAIAEAAKNWGEVELDTLHRGEPLGDLDYEFVIHAAAKTPSANPSCVRYVEDNIVLTKELLAKYPKSCFVFLSTMDVYGKPDVKEITEDTLPYAPSFYGLSKYVAEALVREEASRYIVLRLPAVIGAGSPETFVTRMVRQIQEALPVRIYNAECKFNSLVHIDFLVRVLRKIIINEALPYNEVYNLGVRSAVMLADLPEMIAKKLERDSVKVVKEPVTANCALLSIAKIDQYIQMESIEKAVSRYIDDISRQDFSEGMVL